MTNTDCYALQRYLFMTLDPVHPGAGGYRLGRVDNSIVRDPGTRLPKIPGSSLHGAARSYAAYLYETPEAAGQSQDRIDKPDENPVCYTFGYLKKKGNAGEKAYSGVVNVFDAQILLFPVYSTAGPVWVTTQERLNEDGSKKTRFTVRNTPAQWDENKLLTTLKNCERLNLGWLLLQSAGQIQIDPPTEWQGETWNAVKERIALVHPYLFGHIVNSNLEVRTSVAINPETGAAEEGALYTYEAIPRATFLAAEIALDDYVVDEKRARPFPKNTTDKGNPLPGGEWRHPLDVVHAGLSMMEHLSVGGMGTRGFGRIKIIGNPVHQSVEGLLSPAKSEDQL